MKGATPVPCRPMWSIGETIWVVPKNMDPRVVALLRRRELENIVREWAAQLEKEVARHKARAERWRGTDTWKHFGDLWEQQAIEALSLWDLVRRGLDPKEERRFRGRVALTVRCQAKGHLLARVYPTCALPVFVPSVRTLPAGRPEVWKPRAQREAAFLREYFPWSAQAARDPWIEVFEDGEEVYYYIRGMTALRERHKLDYVEDDQFGLVRPVFFLLCRCGQQIVAVADVMRALDRGDTHLTAIYTD